MRSRFTISSLLLSTLVAVAGCKQQLYTSLPERDANEMIAVLAARGLQADKVAGEKGDFKLELDRSDFSAAIEALRDHGLPRPKFASIGEVFKKDGLVTTANAERLRFMYAMSEELSRTLSMIDGVVEARVHPVLPGGDPLTDKVTPASASVFIKYTPGTNLTMLAPAIKDLVCSSIEGLSYDKVSLIFVPASTMVAVRPEEAAPAASNWAGSNWAGSNGGGPSLSTIGLALAVGLLLFGAALFFFRGRAEESVSPADSEEFGGSPPTRRPSVWQRLRAVLPSSLATSRTRSPRVGQGHATTARTVRLEPTASQAPHQGRGRSSTPSTPPAVGGDVVSIRQERRTG